MVFSQQNPGFHQLRGFSLYRNVLELNAARIQFQSQKVNVNLENVAQREQ